MKTAETQNNKEIKNPLTAQLVFAAVEKHCTDQAMSGEYLHNPTALANKITRSVIISLLSKQQRMIYDVLTNTPKSTSQISKECGLSSKNVSSIIIRMAESTNLVFSKSSGNRKFWYTIN